MLRVLEELAQAPAATGNQVTVYGDNELAINSMAGNCLPLGQACLSWMRQAREIEQRIVVPPKYVCIPSEQNQDCDELSKIVLYSMGLELLIQNTGGADNGMKKWRMRVGALKQGVAVWAQDRKQWCVGIVGPFKSGDLVTVLNKTGTRQKVRLGDPVPRSAFEWTNEAGVRLTAQLFRKAG